MDLSSIANNINYRYQRSSRLQVGGAVSGLDTQSIIEKLMELEAAPLQRLNDKYTQYANLQKAYQKVSSKIREFYNYISDFSLQANLIPKTATSSATNVLNASAAPSALDGAYSVDVVSLATNSLFKSGKLGREIQPTDTFASIDTRYAPVDNSVVKIKVGSQEQQITVSHSDTINDIIGKLEQAFTDLGAIANIVFQDGKLKIESNKAFQISNASGNFTFVFRLNDASLKQAGTNFVLESSGDIGVYSTFKTLSSLGVTSDATIKINGKEITLKPSDTLQTIIQKINNTITDVYATYDDKSGQIVLTSKTTGDNLISVEGDSGLLGVLKLDDTNSTFTLGQLANVKVTFNGYIEEITSKSNSLTYNGVTLNLSAIGSAIVTVGTDKDKIVERVKDFVNKWNELTDFLYTKLTEKKVTNKSPDQMNEDEKLQGLLKDDSFLRRIFDKFRSFLTTTIDGKKLADLGIESGDVGKSFENTMKGRITLNEDKLKKFIDENGPDAVWKFFGNNDTYKGLGIQLKEYSFNLTKFNGEIDTVAGVSGRLEREKRILSKRMVTMMEYLEKKEQQLWAKYSSLESALSKLQAQGAFMAQAFTQRK
ncbi:flagellar hook-associated protein 2 [Fervidobacterium changbaicum]|uniref:Flagellar hook-associated protein 2 n=2 Tax=Fervidobacterium TaxID=2422 RepID=A0AAI8CJB0_FERIS|nr:MULTISPECIES: flagellar filament capping protein FliD [Fervidobacterium]AMW32061.1 flagellar filament capping protein FliD [Fervidobacterium islandicum]QAV33850.1 flagellar hook protein [Fervidobacterium changbaicum]SDH45491.1 flagellar hook-associated protein 2 [Fervidobacterium changbaicum]